ncbi:MAG: hypothetical protein M1835_002584 [Candelina submexicana]|nr:MAG: hypothetical protein M1835_002584 [Candelina submexicana]
MIEQYQGIKKDNRISHYALLAVHRFVKVVECGFEGMEEDTDRSRGQAGGIDDTDTMSESFEQAGLEQECLEQERSDQETLKQQKLKQEQVRLGHERLEQEQLEQVRLEQERLEQERLAQDQLAQDQLAQEQLELERIEQEQADPTRNIGAEYAQTAPVLQRNALTTAHGSLIVTPLKHESIGA